MTNLHKFMEGLNDGLEHSPYLQSLQTINSIMASDEKMYDAVRQVASEISADLINRLADVLQERGLALDGHRIIEGFSAGVSAREERIDQ